MSEAKINMNIQIEVRPYIKPAAMNT